MLKGGPWFVVGKLMVMEAWKLDFVPGRKVIWRAMVWMRLLGISTEFWLSMTILAIVAEVGKPLAMVDFTDLLQKIDYAQFQVEFDSGLPLKPGVLIRGKKGMFSQQLIYENLPSVCYWYGRLGHFNDVCRFQNPLSTLVILSINQKLCGSKGWQLSRNFDSHGGGREGSF